MEIKLSNSDVAKIIDDFISAPISDPYLDKIRVRCAGLREEFPPIQADAFCNDEGVMVLEQYVKELLKT